MDWRASANSTGRQRSFATWWLSLGARRGGRATITRKTSNRINVRLRPFVKTSLSLSLSLSFSLQFLLLIGSAGQFWRTWPKDRVISPFCDCSIRQEGRGDGLDFNRIRLRDLACDCLQSKNIFFLFREKYEQVSGRFLRILADDASGRFKNEQLEEWKVFEFYSKRIIRLWIRN